MHLKGSRVGAYARYSSDRQNETSVDDQLRRLRGFATTHGRIIDDGLTFTDHAISGSSTDRPGFEALMGKIQRREIDVLLVEDTSRLSRDNADALTLYKTLAYYGVQLVAISDGIDSTTKGAKLAYSVKALMSDMYLEDLRDKTLRGMEGRAHSGLSTGGLPIGYRSVPLPGPDPRTPAGYKIEIDPEGADVVRRIFKMYFAGKSLNGIATALNADEVPSPRDKTRHVRKGGWAGSSIRAILYNEKYAGNWTFNERRWIKVPGTNKRRPQQKDASEIVRVERQELRIIDRVTWEGVQARLSAIKAKFTRNAQGKPKGRAHGAVSQHPLSSLMVCGACGAPMIIAGGSAERRYYVCADGRRFRCANRTSVRADIARARILETLRDLLASPAGIAYARKRLAEELGKQARNQDAELRERRARLDRTTKRISNLVAVLASGERSAAITDALRDLEVQAGVERQGIADLQELAAEPIRLPTPEEVLERVYDLEARLQQDPIAGREALRKLFKGGQIRLELGKDGIYTARSELLPLVLLTETPTPASGDTGGGRYTLRVAGAGFEPTTFGL